jgi:hypothetical protein
MSRGPKGRSRDRPRPGFPSSIGTPDCCSHPLKHARGVIRFAAWFISGSLFPPSLFFEKPLAQSQLEHGEITRDDTWKLKTNPDTTATLKRTRSIASPTNVQRTFSASKFSDAWNRPSTVSVVHI